MGSLSGKNEQKLIEEALRRSAAKQEIEKFKEEEQTNIKRYKTQRYFTSEEANSVLTTFAADGDNKSHRKAIEDFLKPAKKEKTHYRNHIIQQMSWGLLWFMIISAFSLVFRINSLNVFNLMVAHKLFTVAVEVTSVLIIIAIALLYVAFGARWPSRHVKFGYMKGDVFLLAVCLGGITSWASGLLEPLKGPVLRTIDWSYLVVSILGLLYFAVIYLLGSNKEKKKERQHPGYKDRSLDNPIEYVEEDILSRNKFAMDMVQYLNRHEQGGYAVGIMGEWGSGKSSVLNLIQVYLPDEVIRINFKPWYFGKDNQEIIPKFFDQLSEELKKKFSYLPKLDKELSSYAKLFSTIQVRHGIFTFSFKELMDRLLPGEGTSLSQLKGDIEKSLSQLNQPIYVFIDDLDRLDPQEVQMVFKLVRLVADFKNITYILAMDENIIVNSLQGLFKRDSGQDPAEHARRYLEKFIQLPVYLPRTGQTELTMISWKMLNELMDDLGKSTEFITEEEFSKYIIKLQYSLRAMKRFINIFELMFRMLEEAVDLKDLTLLLLLKVKNPTLYDYIYLNSVYFLSNGQADIAQERKRFKKLFPDYALFEELLLEILPLSAQLWDASQENKLHLIKEHQLRISNPKVFNRYFQYGLPNKEASNKDIDAFIASLGKVYREKDLLELYSNFMSLYTPDQTNDWIRHRLHRYVGDVRKLQKLLTAVRLRFGYLYNKNAATYSAEQSSLANLARTLMLYAPEEALLEFFRLSQLALSAELYRYASRKNSNLSTEISNILRNRMNEELQHIPSHNYMMKDATVIFELWLELESSIDVKSKRIAGWLTDSSDMASFLQFAMRIGDNTLIDRPSHIYLYLRCAQLLELLPTERLASLLIPSSGLPDSLEQLESLQESNDEQLFIKAFSYAYHNMVEFVEDHLLEMIHNGRVNHSRYFVELLELLNRSANPDIQHKLSELPENLQALNKDLLNSNTSAFEENHI